MVWEYPGRSWHGHLESKKERSDGRKDKAAIDCGAPPASSSASSAWVPWPQHVLS